VNPRADIGYRVADSAACLEAESWRNVGVVGEAQGCRLLVAGEGANSSRSARQLVCLKGACTCKDSKANGNSGAKVGLTRGR
jgi:hypothetical protein